LRTPTLSFRPSRASGADATDPPVLDGKKLPKPRKTARAKPRTQ